ncbi:unnamed protein product, partial [Musa acuminata var. zebrina]
LLLALRNELIETCSVPFGWCYLLSCRILGDLIVGAWETFSDCSRSCFRRVEKH